MSTASSCKRSTSPEDEDEDLKTILGQRRKQCWTADEAVANCSKCGAEFTWCLRRHHCRACGEIFCYRCCANLNVLPRSVEQFPSRNFVSRHPTPPPPAAESERTSYVKAAKSTTKYIGKAAYQYYFGKQTATASSATTTTSGGAQDEEDNDDNDDNDDQASSPTPKREKTCDRCHTKLAHAHMVEQYMPKLRRQTVAQLASLIRQRGANDETLQSAAISLLRSWREIQYALPTQQPTLLESQMLHVNWQLIANHSCWRVMLAKSAYVDGIDKQLQSDIVAALSQPCEAKDDNFSVQCGELLCRDQICQQGWSLESCVTLLQDEFFNSDPIWRSCAAFLMRAEQSTVELSLFVINLCWALRFEPTERRKSINNVLLHHAQRDQEFFADVFWHSMSAVHDLGIENRIRRYYVALLRLMRQSNVALFDQLFAGKKMLQALDAAGRVQAVQDSDTCFPEFVNQEFFRMPVNSQHTLLSLDLQSSKIMRSATRPMVVPCCSSQDDARPPFRFNVLLKREDIRMDAIIMNTIRFMRRLLETQFASERIQPLVDKQHQQRIDAPLCRERDQKDGADCFGIVCYRCVPTSNVSGVIEIVPQSTTLDDICNKFDMKLLQFIRSRNPQTTDVEMLRERFIRSTAASCVITYLLGIGDRHLENIMLTRDGHLFHIDFGYVMGDDPKKSLIGSPAMRLTNDMVDVLGGLESENYKRFQHLCTDIFNFLRRQYTTIALLLMPLTFIGTCSVANLEREIQTRFVPTESKSQANIQLCNTLNDSRGSVYVPSMVDVMHSGGKAASSLLTEPVMAIVSLIPKSLTSLGSSGTSSSNSLENHVGGKGGQGLRKSSSQSGGGGNQTSSIDIDGKTLMRTSGSSGGSSSGGRRTFSGRNSFDRETAALGRGVQAPLRSPLGDISPLQERLEREQRGGDDRGQQAREGREGKDGGREVKEGKDGGREAKEYEGKEAKEGKEHQGKESRVIAEKK